MPWGYDRALYALPFDHRGCKFGMARDCGRGAGIHRLCGRTHGFLGTVMAWRSKHASREQAVAAIAERYREFVDLSERAHIPLPSQRSDWIRSEARPDKEA